MQHFAANHWRIQQHFLVLGAEGSWDLWMITNTDTSQIRHLNISPSFSLYIKIKKKSFRFSVILWNILNVNQLAGREEEKQNRKSAHRFDTSKSLSHFSSRYIYNEDFSADNEMLSNLTSHGQQHKAGFLWFVEEMVEMLVKVEVEPACWWGGGKSGDKVEVVVIWRWWWGGGGRYRFPSFAFTVTTAGLRYMRL